MAQRKPSTFINQDDTWVFTDISYYADRDDINDYMKSIYPIKYDKPRNRNIQDFKIETFSNGDHRVWAPTALSDDVKKWLEDINNESDKKYAEGTIASKRGTA